MKMTSDWLSFLLEQSTLADQVAILRKRALDNEDGLSQILDEAMKLARSQPVQARQLTILCTQVAEELNTPAIIPRAAYFRAQTHAASGEFNLARQLIEEARASYDILGDHLAALRTNIGLMHILSELGHYEQVLFTGDKVLERVGETEDHTSMMLAAFAHQNKGVCYEKTARYEQAQASYAAAEALLVRLSMPERIGEISNNRGIVLMYLGRVNEALQVFEKAANTAKKNDLTLLLAQVTSNIGEAYLMQGHYTRALSAFRKANDLSIEISAKAHQFIAQRRIADAYLLLNLYPEALSTYQEVVPSLSEAGMSNHLARALWGMGSTLIGQSHLIEAEKVLGEALPLLNEHIPLLCRVMLEQATAQHARGERELAIRTARTALDTISDRYPVERIYALLQVADLLLPDTSTAEPYLLEAQSKAEELALRPLSVQVKQRLGRLYRLQGQMEKAEGYLSDAISQISELRGTLAQEALRTYFLQDKLSAYEELIQLYLAQSDQASVRRAFTIAEQAKSRTLVELLTGVIKPTAPKEQAELTRLHADLNAVYNQFLDPNAEVSSKQELLSAASQLEQQIRRLRLTAPESESDLFDASLDPQTLQEQLPDDITLLAYHIIGDEIHAFISQAGQIQAIRHISQVSTIQNLLLQLETQWNRFRAGRRFVERHMKLLERSTQRVLAALYNELIAPLELEGNLPSKLVIVPHGVLHQVPFHALYDKTQYLIDRCEISYAPSATIFALIGRRQQEYKHGLIVGVPDPLIPAVEIETKAVTETLHTLPTTQLNDQQATLSAVSQHSSAHDIVHFACHGLFRADNPMFSALKLADGWLTAADIMQLNLTDSTVVLSACESGRGTQKGDAIIGLPRAFLGAGASTLIVSLWVVQDDTTTELMKKWYEQLVAPNTGMPARLTPAVTALRTAQLAIKADYPHPYYWAPFVLIGKRY